MNKITLNFFGETLSISKPKSLLGLRSEISKLFCLSSEDASEILLTYMEKGEKKIISNDEDLKTFLKSNITLLDLDISQSSKIYKDNLNQLQEEKLKDQKTLEELIKKKEELTKIKETKFIPEKKELKEIENKMRELLKRQCEIRKKIYESARQIDRDISENDKKIRELQKKLGISTEKDEKLKSKQMVQRPFYNNQRFAPPVIKLPITKPCPHVHPCFFERKYHIHPPKISKLQTIECNDIPKKTNKTMTESSNSKEEIDIKMKTIDDWGKHILSKTKEITDKLAEKFKGLESLNISINSTKDKKEEEKKEIHYNFQCDGCGMNPIVGKRYKCNSCRNFDYCEKCYEKNKSTHKHSFNEFEKPVLHRVKLNYMPNNNLIKPKFHPGMKFNGRRPEGVPKKMEHYPTMGNIFQKENAAKKVIHYGVKCDQCKKYPIIGVRFKCAVCPDFDFCEECEKKFAAKHNHAFYKIYEPKMRELIPKNKY
jgi:hypothetical protein